MRKWLMLILMLAACTPAAPTPTPTAVPQTTLTISGSSSVSSLLTAVEADFEAANSAYNLNVLSGSGTGFGVTGIVEGTLQIAAMARPPQDEETAQGVQYVSFGSAAVVFVVHPELEVTNLTLEQARAIFLGETTNWSEVGGQDLAIVTYVREETETPTTLLRQASFGDEAFPEATTNVMTSTDSLLSAVEVTPGGIGYASWTSVVAGDKNVATPTLEGAAPDTAEYPVLLTVGIGYMESQQALVQPFVDWLLSDAGAAALNELGVITASS